MKKFLLLVLTMILLASMASCSLFGGKSGDDLSNFKTVTSSKSGLSIDIPKNWDDIDMNPVASIQVGDKTIGQLLLIVEESKVDFEGSFTLNDYASIIYDNTMASFESHDDPEIYDVKIAGNLNSKQFIVAGSLSGIKVTEMVTCFETTGFFHQIVVWSSQSKFESSKPVFNEVLDSITI